MKNNNKENTIFTYRLERLDHLAQKFRHRCQIHEEWAEGKEEMLQSQDYLRCGLNQLKVTTTCTRNSAGKYVLDIIIQI